MSWVEEPEIWTIFRGTFLVSLLLRGYPLHTNLRAIFVVGKGGVGKSTCAAVLALSLSKTYDTLIVSLDPAPHLGEVFQTSLYGETKEIAPKLWAMEVNMERAIENYLKESARKLGEMYSYLKAINLEGYLDTIRLSPGIEEYATLEEMERIISETEGKHEIIIFDMPPTGLTLRVLALPQVSLLWGERLVKLRKQILSKRGVIEKIEGVKKFVLEGKEFTLSTTEEKDEVMQELLKYMKEVQKVRELQMDAERCLVVPVMNPDRLSFFETQRTLDTLKKLGMPIGAIVMNKLSGKRQELEVVAKAEATFGKRIEKIPLLDMEPIGMNALEEFSKYLNAKEWLPPGGSHR